MYNIKPYFILFLQLTVCTILCQKSTAGVSSFEHPLYLGIAGGYGSTTWEGLVPPKKNQNIAMSLSTPTEVSEGGGAWGFFGGYELNPYFALEAGYMRYPDAQVSFDPISICCLFPNQV